MLSNLISYNFILLAASFSFIIIGVESGQAHINKRYDYYEPQNHHHHHQEESESNESHHSSDSHSSNIGSGLRSIADHSASQANSAVLNQHVAGVQAAYLAKNTLAQSALQAAGTALTALAGKEALLKNLEYQHQEAEKNLEIEASFLQSTKKAIAIGKQVQLLAQNQISVAASALHSAQSVAEHAEIAVKEYIAQFSMQNEMVSKAKAYVEQTGKKLGSAKIDFEATKSAAEKAHVAAQEAKNNAVSAGQHASASYISHDVIGYSSDLSNEHHFKL